MAFTCNNRDALLVTLRNVYPTAKFSHPTALQTKIVFDCKLVVNVYNTGKGNFQGNSYENPKVPEILNLVETINRQ